MHQYTYAWGIHPSFPQFDPDHLGFLSSRLGFLSSLEKPTQDRDSAGMKSIEPIMFAPLVVRLDHVLGHHRFIRLRGKAIATHTQIIHQFFDSVRLERPCRQHLIKIVHHNGKRLGLLA